jgi:putative methionine-R-sulfoxide reductase with GAF domain
MNSMKRNFLAMTPGERWGLGLLFTLFILLGVFGAATFDDLLASDRFVEYVGGLVPLFTAAAAVTSIFLVWFRRSTLAVYLTTVSIMAAMLATVMSAQGYMLPTMSVILLIPSSLALLMLKGRAQNSILLAAIVGSFAIILLDTFWPFERIGVGIEDVQLATVLAVILLIVYFVFMGTQFRNIALQVKLTLAFFFTTAVPALILVGFVNTSTSDYLQIEAERSLLVDAEQLADSLDMVVRTNMDTVRISAGDARLVEFLALLPGDRSNSSTYRNTLDAFTAIRNRDQINILSVALLDRSGLNVLDSNGQDIGQNESNESYFIQAVVTRFPYVSNLAFHQDEQILSITFSAPVRDELGEIIGVLRVRINAGIFQQAILNFKGLRAEGTFGMIVDQNYMVLANSDNPFAINKSISPLFKERLAVLKSSYAVPDLPAEKLVSEIPDMAKGLSNLIFSPTFTGEFQASEMRNGVEHLEKAGAVRLSSRPWYVIVIKSQDVLLAPAQQQTRSLVLTGSVATAVSLLIAGIVAQLIAAPVLHLNRTAERITGGDLTARAEANSNDEIGDLANTFNSMTAELSNLIASLEQRVADRTKALATSADVSRRLSTILDPAELVKEVVDQLQQAFNYYHVHIYLAEGQNHEMVMAGGTGEAGKIMLARGHRLAPGLGLVGRAVATATPVLVQDVTKAPGWVANPLLPDTRSELAVPLMFSGQVVGVLDVQQNAINGLSQTDADLLQAIASQVAIGLNNARVYIQTQHRADREAMATTISQRIQRTNSAEEALKVAVRELGRALNAPKVTVKLGEKNGHELPKESVK